MSTDTAATSGTAQASEKPQILVVDDSRLMRAAIKKILADEFTLIEAVDGNDGWEKLNANPAVQVVFTDLSMPELDGFGLLKLIRDSGDAHVKDIPVIVITGAEDDQPVRERALSSGATDFITKPFQSVQIKARATAHATSQRKLQTITAELEEQATVDAVTGLVNERYFHKRGNEALSYAIRHKTDIALLSLRVDNFCALRDTYANAVEGMLKGVGEILGGHVRREDTVAHFGDGRFMVLLPGTNPVGAKQLGKRVLAEISEKSFMCGKTPYTATASLGAATPDIKAGLTLEAIIELAERRLSLAFSAGGNCLVSDELSEQAAADQSKVHARATEEARVRAEEEARLAAEAKARAAEEARLAAEAKARAAEEARIAAEAKARAEEEARLAAEAEAQARAEEAARLRAVEEARLAAEAEAKARAEEEARLAAEAEAQARAEETARLRAEEEARIVAEAKARAEEEARLVAEAEAQARAEEATRLRAEEEARIVAEAEARAEEEALLAAEAEAQAHAGQAVEAISTLSLEPMALDVSELPVESAVNDADEQFRLAMAEEWKRFEVGSDTMETGVTETETASEFEFCSEAVAEYENDQPMVMDAEPVAETAEEATPEVPAEPGVSAAQYYPTTRKTEPSVVDDGVAGSRDTADIEEALRAVEDEHAEQMDDAYSPLAAMGMRMALPLLKLANRLFRLGIDHKIQRIEERLG